MLKFYTLFDKYKLKEANYLKLHKKEILKKLNLSSVPSRYGLHANSVNVNSLEKQSALLRVNTGIR